MLLTVVLDATAGVADGLATLHNLTVQTEKAESDKYGTRIPAICGDSVSVEASVLKCMHGSISSRFHLTLTALSCHTWVPNLM